jgi:ubiquinone/menaquinone biosynthesis C-methylase UbiE
MLTLDVGCGHDYRGTVNIDLHPDATEHRSKNQQDINDVDLDVKHIPNFVVADCHHLPFRDHIFDNVIARHLMEHLPNPLSLLVEMRRVSKHHITIITPTKWSDAISKLRTGSKELHLHAFDLPFYHTVADRMNLRRFTCKYTEYEFFPNSRIPLLRFPTEITFIGELR